MHPKTRYSFIGLLMILAMSVGLHSTAKAQTSSNYVSYRCDLKNDQIILTYDDPIPGDQLGVNNWNMDALWGAGSDGDHRVPRPIVKTCQLSGGSFGIKITPNGNPDVQGMCGGDPSTGAIEISVNGHYLFGTDFNDSGCDQNNTAETIDEIKVAGKTREISILYGDSSS